MDQWRPCRILNTDQSFSAGPSKIRTFPKYCTPFSLLLSSYSSTSNYAYTYHPGKYRPPKFPQIGLVGLGLLEVQLTLSITSTIPNKRQFFHLRPLRGASARGPPLFHFHGRHGPYEDRRGHTQDLGLSEGVSPGRFWGIGSGLHAI